MTFRMPTRARLSLSIVVLTAEVAFPIAVYADQWVSPVTPTQAISGDSGGFVYYDCDSRNHC
jgi:hypothetical protein